MPVAESCAIAPGPKLVAAVIQACGAAVPFAQSLLPKQGMGLGPDVKSLGSPKKSQRSPLDVGLFNSLVMLKSLEVSCGPHGRPVCTVTIELTCQPARSCNGDALPGRA